MRVQSGVLIYTYNPSNWEVEAGRLDCQNCYEINEVIIY